MTESKFIVQSQETTGNLEQARKYIAQAPQTVPLDATVPTDAVLPVESYEVRLARLEAKQAKSEIPEDVSAVKESQETEEQKQYDRKIKDQQIAKNDLENRLIEQDIQIKRITAEKNIQKTEAETEQIVKLLKQELQERSFALITRNGCTALSVVMLVGGVVLLCLGNPLGIVSMGSALGLLPAILRSPSPSSGTTGKKAGE